MFRCGVWCSVHPQPHGGGAEAGGRDASSSSDRSLPRSPGTTALVRWAADSQRSGEPHTVCQSAVFLSTRFTLILPREIKPSAERTVGSSGGVGGQGFPGRTFPGNIELVGSLGVLTEWNFFLRDNDKYTDSVGPFPGAAQSQWAWPKNM